MAISAFIGDENSDTSFWIANFLVCPCSGSNRKSDQVQMFLNLAFQILRRGDEMSSLNCRSYIAQICRPQNWSIEPSQSFTSLEQSFIDKYKYALIELGPDGEKICGE